MSCPDRGASRAIIPIDSNDASHHLLLCCRRARTAHAISRSWPQYRYLRPPRRRLASRARHAAGADVRRSAARGSARRAALLDRGPGGASLTAAGEALLPRARAALAAVEEGKRAVAEVMGLTAGTVRLGAERDGMHLLHSRASWRGSAPSGPSRSVSAKRTTTIVLVASSKRADLDHHDPRARGDANLFRAARSRPGSRRNGSRTS